jgi:hypothetical protein
MTFRLIIPGLDTAAHYEIEWSMQLEQEQLAELQCLE